MIRKFPNGETQYTEGVLLERERTGRTETSKYPEEEKINKDFLSSGERNGKSPNQSCFGNFGVVGLYTIIKYKWKFLESCTKEGDRPVHVTI